MPEIELYSFRNTIIRFQCTSTWNKTFIQISFDFYFIEKKNHDEDIESRFIPCSTAPK